MVPLHLHLRNFMSYGLEGGDLDLRNIHLACLSGGNGNGKSTLIDAITWALWGKSRAAREDDLVRQGATEMEVEFEFATNHAVYRVIRKRVLRKSASTAVLELAVRDGDVYRAITGSSVAETERTIADQLRLSYETFINSSLLLQGKADLFTVKRPSERKEVLAEILGLGQYELLAEQARERERDFKAEVERHTMRIEELDRFIAALPVAEERLAATEVDLQILVASRIEKEEACAELDKRVHTLRELSQSLGRLRKRYAELELEESRIQVALARAHDDQAGAETLLQDEAQIRRQLELLQAARRTNDSLSLLLQQDSALRQKITSEKAAIDQEEARLTERLRGVKQTLATVEAAGVRLQQRRGELEALRREAVGLPPLEARLEACTARDNLINQEVSSHRAAVDAITQQRKALRDKYKQLKQLKGAPICPICRSELSPEQHQHVLEDYEQDGASYNAQIAEHEAAQQNLLDEQTTLRQDLARIQSEVLRLRTLCRGEGKLEAEVAELERIIQTGTQAGQEIALLTTILSTGDFAHDARAVRHRLEAETAALGYNPDAHRQVQREIAALAPVEGRLAALDRAREARQTAALEVRTCETNLAAVMAERTRLSTECGPLEAATAELPALLAAATTERERLHQLRAAESTLHQQLGSLRRQIDEGRARIGERDSAVAARTLAEQQVWAHRELALIFGKRGVQAMLIENALPELEEDANELLARMTDNSTHVQFATQRQGTGGKTIETLEIKIADNMGTRTYEMFSGGEAFRIDFAIRIALSRLLARRAGADLSFLLIDEGFGTQDATGRDRLVEAITTIADDFEKILVITHIDELKELFDVHIEVSKGPAGSHITVSAA